MSCTVARRRYIVCDGGLTFLRHNILIFTPGKHFQAVWDYFLVAEGIVSGWGPWRANGTPHIHSTACRRTVTFCCRSDNYGKHELRGFWSRLRIHADISSQSLIPGHMRFVT